MKRDWDVVRSILFALEDLEPSQELRDSGIEGQDSRIVNYHFRILAEAGLIDVIEMNSHDGYKAIATRLTWYGHEFLDHVRSESVWKKVKESVREKSLGLSIDLIMMLAKASLKELFDVGS